MQVDMSPEAVTGRMKMLDQLWELAVALQSSEIEDRDRTTSTLATAPSRISGDDPRPEPENDQDLIQ
ncbi:MAG: hypothetical protein ABI999_12930 [Acidobacteriota bacterium]